MGFTASVIGQFILDRSIGNPRNLRLEMDVGGDRNGLNYGRVGKVSSKKFKQPALATVRSLRDRVASPQLDYAESAELDSWHLGSSTTLDEIEQTVSNR